MTNEETTKEEHYPNLRAAAENVRDGGGERSIVAGLILDFLDQGKPSKARDLVEKLAERRNPPS